MAPEDLSTAGQNAAGPQTELDATGDAVAVWQRFNGANNIVQVSERPAGGDWSEPEDLSVLGLGARQPRLAVNPAGDAVVVWRSGGVNGIVKASVRPAGGDWSEPEDLSAPGPNAEMPRVAIDAAGNAVAVWLHSTFLPGDASTFVVQAASRPAGGDWSEPEDLADQGHNFDGPELAVNTAGDAIAVWDADLAAGDLVQAATRPAGGDWSEPQDLPGSGPADAPEVALDPAGNAVVVWAGLFTGLVQVSERPAGGDWSEPQDLSAPGGDPTSPWVVVDAAGNAVAVWARSDGSNQIVQASARAAGGDWSEPRDLSAPGEDAFAPRVGVDAAGDAVAVWSRSNGANDIIQAAAYDAVAPELRDLQIPASGAVGVPVSFAVSPFDAFTAVAATSWSFGDGGGASGDAVSHVYAAAGTYQVMVTAVDAGGNANTQAGTTVIVSSSGPPGPPPNPPSPPTPPLRLSALKVDKTSLRKLLRTGKLVVATKVNDAAKVALTGRAKLEVRARGKSRTKFVSVFKRKTARFVAAGEKRVTLVLSRKGRRALRGLRKVRLTIAGKATDAAGKTASKRVALTLRR